MSNSLKDSANNVLYIKRTVIDPIKEDCKKMSELTLEEVLEKYEEVEVTITKVYSSNVFTYTGVCKCGELMVCVVDDRFNNSLCKRLHLIEKVKDVLLGEYTCLYLNNKIIYS